MYIIQPGALTQEEGAYIVKMDTDLQILLPQIKSNLFADAALYQPQQSAARAVASVNIGRTELKRKTQRINQTEYDSIEMKQRWVRIKEWGNNYPLTAIDRLSGIQNIAGNYMQAVGPAIKRVTNKAGLEALLGTAREGNEFIGFTDKALPIKNVIKWDRAGGENITDIFKKLLRGFALDDVDTDETMFFTAIDPFAAESFANDPEYVSILNMNDKVLPTGKLAMYQNIQPKKYSTMPYRIDENTGKKIYRAPVWAKEALVITPWLDPKIEVTIDAGRRNIRNMQVDVFTDAVRAFEEGVRVIEYELTTDEEAQLAASAAGGN